MSNLNQRNSNYSNLGGENPVFNFESPTVDNRMQDKGKNDKDKDIDDPQEQWVEGLYVEGKDINDDKTYKGKIISIKKDKSGEIEYVTIQDSDEQKRKLNIDGLIKAKKDNKKIKNFNEWIEFY